METKSVSNVHRRALRSETTYEEWKLGIKKSHKHCPSSSETTYEEWKHALYANAQGFGGVLRLPMRNGNHKERCVESLHLPVLRLPMRNGNEYPDPDSGRGSGSETTYEEWKPFRLRTSREVGDGSETTYEEWKPGKVVRTA